MLKTLFSGYGTVAVLLLVSAACTQRDSTHVDMVDVVVSGGTGGTPGSVDSGDAGQLAGSGGAGGSTGVDMSDAGLARFRATLAGETVSLVALDPVWLERCQRNPQLVQRSGDAWVLLRDERPEAFNLNHAAHYLDGAYHSDCRLSLGCDVGGCEAFPKSEPFDSDYAPLIAREYVEVGQIGAPTCEGEDAGINVDAGSDAGVRLIPSIESRAASGPLGVRVRYYRDSGCGTEAITAEIPVE